MNLTQRRAAQAAQIATLASLDLLSIVRFGVSSHGLQDAQEAELGLLRAAMIAMELAGFHPDEHERGDLYRALASYVSILGED